MRAAVAVTSAEGTVDTKDLSAALEKADTKWRFVTVKSQDDLTAIMNAPLANRIGVARLDVPEFLPPGAPADRRSFFRSGKTIRHQIRTVSTKAVAVSSDEVRPSRQATSK